MARAEDKHWKPKIFLLPSCYTNGDIFPNKRRQNVLEVQKYGSCNVEGDFDRSWTIEQLEDKVKGLFPHHEAEHDKTRIEFAKITKNSKKINVHDLVKGDTVADLEKSHGRGILVIRQKLEIKSPKKLQKQTLLKFELESQNGSLNQVQYELDTPAQSKRIKLDHPREADKLEIKSPKKILIQTLLKFEPESHNGSLNQVQCESDTPAQSKRIKLDHPREADKASNASLSTVPKQSESTLDIKSPKKPQNQIRIKSEPTSSNAPFNQVQYELDILAQSGGIKIAHLNCQSLCNKKDELKLLLHCRTDIDVMTLSETWMRPNNSNDSFNVTGYTIMARKDGVPKNSGRPRGGVLTYVKDHLARSARECSIDLEEGLEAVCVDIELDDDGPSKRLTDHANSGACVKKALLRVINVYVPPGTREQIVLLKKLQRSMDNLRAADKCCKSTSSRGIGDKKHSCSCKTNYVILGDFNCDQKTDVSHKDMGSVIGEKVQTLNELERSHRLSQLVNGFTRVELRKERGRDTYKKTESLLDLVYTDNTASVLASGVVHIGMSDHFMVYCAWERAIEKGLRKRKAAPLPTQDAAFRQFSTQVKSDIDLPVYVLIRDRDSAIVKEDWVEYERLKCDIKKAKKNNKNDQKQNEKAMKAK